MAQSQRFNDHAACIYAWLHQYCHRGHASHLFFEGNTLYSYGRHYSLATIYRGMIFLNNQYYSVTTAIHRAKVIRAANFLRIWRVAVMPVSADPATEIPFLEGNLRHWLAQIRDCLDELSRHPQRRSLERRIAELYAVIREFIALLAIAPYAALTKLLASLTLHNLSAFFRREHKIRLVKAATGRNPRSAFLCRLKQWERGKIAIIPDNEVPDDMGALAHLRYNPASRRIETSKNVAVPAALAYRCWCGMRRQMAQQQTNCQIPIFQWTLSQIHRDFIVINCHTIPMSQVNKIAQLLGWTDREFDAQPAHGQQAASHDTGETRF